MTGTVPDVGPTAGRGRPGAPSAGGGTGRLRPDRATARQTRARIGYGRDDGGHRPAGQHRWPAKSGGRPGPARSGEPGRPPPDAQNRAGAADRQQDRPNGTVLRPAGGPQGVGERRPPGGEHGAGRAEHGPDRDSPDGRRGSRPGPTSSWPSSGSGPTTAAGDQPPGPRSCAPPAHRAVQAPGRTAAGHRQRAGLGRRARTGTTSVTRITERMAAGIGAYERERYRDASRILKTVVDAVPNSPSARELLGPQPVPPGVLEGRPSQPRGVRRADRLGRPASGADGLPSRARAAEAGGGAVHRVAPGVARSRGPVRGPAGPGRHPGRQRRSRRRR